MGQVAGYHHSPAANATPQDEAETSLWSPRTRAVTVIGAALASWAVFGAILYLIGAAIWG
jgi:hypothetical protein